MTINLSDLLLVLMEARLVFPEPVPPPWQFALLNSYAYESLLFLNWATFS